MGRRVRKQRLAERSDSPCPAENRSQPQGRRPAEERRPPDPVARCLPPSSDRRVVLGVCVFLLLAVALVFAQTLRHEFINYDDNEYVYENSLVTRGLTTEGLVAAFTRSYANNWHPLTWLSHVLDWQVYGRWAGGHHLGNVLLHAITAVLLFLVLRRMTGAVWPSAFVAAVFAIHPLRVESVAWVAERKDVLSGLFFVLTLGAYASYVCHRFSLFRYLTVVLLFALGLMAKPMLVTLPFVLLLLDYWPLGRMRLEKNEQTEVVGGSQRGWLSLFARLVLEKVPLLLMAAGSCVATVWAQEKAIAPHDYLAVPWRIGNAVVSYAAYVGQIFYPADLVVYYPHSGPTLPVWQIVASSCVLLGIMALAVVLWRRRAYLLVGWLWYLGTLVPVIGLVQVGIQARADRYTYLTQIGLYVALAWAVADVCRSERRRRWLCSLGAGLALAALMGCTWRQASLWRDSETLWRHASAHSRSNPVAHNNFGNALADRGAVEEAMAQYRMSLELDPNSVEGHNNLGNALADRKQLDEAIVHYRKALKFEPGHAYIHNNLGNALAGRGELEKGIVHFQRALEIKPEFAEAYNNYGAALVSRGELDEAIDKYLKALEVRPDYPEAHNNLGNALADRKQVEEAIAEYRKALELRPNYADAHNNLGAALAGRGEVEEAIAHFQKALKLKPDYAQAHNSLGNAFAGREQFDEAIAEYRKALKIKPDSAEGHNNLGNALARCKQTDEAISEYRKALELEPECVEAYNNLGAALAGRGEIDEAIAQHRKALEIKPDYAEAHNNLGTALIGRGDVDEAIAEYRKAIELQPDYAQARYNLAIALAGRGKVDEAIAQYRKAVELKPDYVDARSNLAILLASQGKLDEAIEHYSIILREKPDDALAHVHLANVLARQEKLDEAVVHYRAAIRTNPRHAGASVNLGSVLIRQGKPREALAQWRDSLRLTPDAAPLLNAIAWLLATSSEASLRNGSEAVGQAQRAVNITGGKVPELIDTLAAAYAEAGEFPKAIETAQEALALAEQQKNTALAEAVQARIKLYRAGSPFHETPPVDSGRP